MPLQATSGAASYDGFGGGAAAAIPYIEDVFSTYLYSGNGTSQSINNGIDLAGKGGLVWTKSRTNVLIANHNLYDTARGPLIALTTNNTNAQNSTSGTLTFDSTGFSVGSSGIVNSSLDNFSSWTFRKQPKFFDVVTYTGNGTTQAISHSLGSKPGFIIVKQTDSANSWITYHQALGASYRTILNLTNASLNTIPQVFWGNNSTAVEPTTTQFTVGSNDIVNASGGTYVAYLFAHNAGGFGLTGTDNVISCGSVTTDGSGFGVVDVGFEPQWILFKSTNFTENWIIVDNMRGVPGTGSSYIASRLNANTSDAEGSNNTIQISSTGFKLWMSSTINYSYIAIRRPMKTPTTGTSVFSPVVRAGTSAVTTVSTSFPVDLAMIRDRSSGSFNTYDRLRGAPLNLRTAAQNADASATNTLTGFDTPTGVKLGDDSSLNWVNTTGQNYINYLFKRAPGFMDVVCYTGTGAAMTINHNLGVTPEMAIIKNRSSGTTDWGVWHQSISPSSGILFLNNTAPRSTGYIGTRTSTTFAFSTGNAVTSASGNNYVAYFFATLAGISKVGTYTGTGTTLQIDCGFTAGARFVLIRRTDATLSGNWYVWDTARGITSGNDPYSIVNTTSAETTTTDYIDPYSAGFEISSTAPAEINGSGNSFIYLAIA